MSKVCRKHHLIGTWTRYSKHMGMDKLDEHEQDVLRATFMAGANVVMAALALCDEEADFRDVFAGMSEEMNGFIQEVILKDKKEDEMVVH